MTRTNEGVINSVSMLEEIIADIDYHFSKCKESTQGQVSEMQGKVAGFSHTEESILENLLENKKHIELMLAKMKM